MASKHDSCQALSKVFKMSKAIGEVSAKALREDEQNFIDKVSRSTVNYVCENYADDKRDSYEVRDG